MNGVFGTPRYWLDSEGLFDIEGLLVAVGPAVGLVVGRDVGRFVGLVSSEGAGDIRVGGC